MSSVAVDETNAQLLNIDLPAFFFPDIFDVISPQFEFGRQNLIKKRIN